MDEEENGAEALEIVAPVEQVEEVAEQETEQREAITIESIAAEMGHRPLDKWTGDPDKWKPADEFVRGAVSVNKNLTRNMKEVKEQVANMARTSAQLTEQAVARERERIMAEKQDAFDVGDNEAFQKADQALAALPTVAPALVPEAEDFIQRNSSWFQKDMDATNWAIARAAELERQGISPARQIPIVEREARQMFPEHFKEAAKPAPLNKPGNRGASVQAKGFASLPADVQAAALDYEKRLGAANCSREEYARIYYNEQGVGA